MKTISLSVELSRFAMDQSTPSSSANTIVEKIENLLKNRPDSVGEIQGKHILNQRTLGQDIRLKKVQLNFEKQSLLVFLVNFRPRAQWEIQGFRFV